AIVKALVDCKVAGEPIRKGTRILFPLTLMLRNEHNDGDEFRPERWLGTSGGSIDEKQRAEFLGFGFGPRQCPGRHLAVREVLCIVALLLRSFDDLQLGEGHDALTFSSPLTICPSDLPVRLKCHEDA
ncbi:hypothetical protein FOZ62_001216, partial [Perkinsus olseni]